jgi:solute carrier family 10 (sodium/bile acid cotransporter), member 7
MICAVSFAWLVISLSVFAYIWAVPIRFSLRRSLVTIVLAGLGLKTEEFNDAMQRMQFNAFVNIFNFFVVSAIVFAGTRGLIASEVLSKEMANGMVMCACLPMTISSVAVLTKISGGDEAAAIFNAAFSNMLGIFISPVLILLYVGVSGDLEYEKVFISVGARVVLPVIIGQILQRNSLWAVQFVHAYKKFFRQAQLYAVVWVVHTSFCKTFTQEREALLTDIFLMVLLQLCFFYVFTVLSWYSLKFSFPNSPTLRVMGLFGTCFEGVACGLFNVLLTPFLLC